VNGDNYREAPSTANYFTQYTDTADMIAHGSDDPA